MLQNLYFSRIKMTKDGNKRRITNSLWKKKIRQLESRRVQVFLRRAVYCTSILKNFMLIFP